MNKSINLRKMDETVVVQSSLPSCSNVVDSRINCKNSASLKKIVDITLKNTADLFSKDNMNDHRSEVMAQFTEVFKNALQQNITVNEMPWVPDKNTLSAPEMEDHKMMVDDAVLNELCKTVTRVAHKRKNVPPFCVRIANAKMQHCMQNLKKVMREEILSPKSLKSLKKTTKKDCPHLETFSTFCKDFVSAQETVEQKLKERRNLLKKINYASSIKLQQKTVLKCINTDETIELTNR